MIHERRATNGINTNDVHPVVYRRKRNRVCPSMVIKEDGIRGEKIKPRGCESVIEGEVYIDRQGSSTPPPAKKKMTV